MRTWERRRVSSSAWWPVDVSPRSALARFTVDLRPGQIYDDGAGNQYRYHDTPEPPTQETPT